MANGDQIAQQMLAMAEYFRQRYEIRRAIKCSLGASKVAQSDCFKILTVHQTGKLYHLYTHESEQAEKFLKLAYTQMCSTQMVDNTQSTMYDLMREYRLEAACMLAEHHLAEGLPSEVALFTKDLQDARVMPLLYTKLSFLCAEGAMGERKSENAIRILDELRFFLDQHPETKHLAAYALISRLHVRAHLHHEVSQKELEEVVRTVDAFPEELGKSNMEMYYMCVQLASYIDQGMVRTAKQLLKNLQQRAQQRAINRGFRWADPTFNTAFVCVLTQASMFQNCNRERAIKYYNHAIRSIKDYSERSRTLESGVAHSVRRLKMLADETMCQTKMINCELISAMETLHEMLSDMNNHPALQVMGVPRAHALLGMLALYLENSDLAEKQFLAAVRTTMPWDTHFTQLLAAHRGLLYLQQARQAEFYDLDDQLGLRKLDVSGGTLHMRGILKFIHALHAYLNNKTQDCRVRVHEILDVTKSEDMFRLYTYALLLFAVLSDQAKLQTIPVSNVIPTIEWANKSSDVALLAWTYEQLIQIKNGQGVDFQEEQTILMAHLQTLEQAQIAMRGHKLKFMIEWTSESLEPLFPRNLMP